MRKPLTDDQRMKRNLNPTAEAVAAMYIWHEGYAAQRGGSMDFYDRLSATEKRVCRDCVRAIREASDAH